MRCWTKFTRMSEKREIDILASREMNLFQTVWKVSQCDIVPPTTKMTRPDMSVSTLSVIWFGSCYMHAGLLWQKISCYVHRATPFHSPQGLKYIQLSWSEDVYHSLLADSCEHCSASHPRTMLQFRMGHEKSRNISVCSHYQVNH